MQHYAKTRNCNMRRADAEQSAVMIKDRQCSASSLFQKESHSLVWNLHRRCYWSPNQTECSQQQYPLKTQAHDYLSASLDRPSTLRNFLATKRVTVCVMGMSRFYDA